MARRTSSSRTRSASSSGKRGRGAAKSDAATSPDQPTGEAAAPRKRRVPPLLFEIAWEVCNQVGGIYTVLRSKAPTMVDEWGNRYCLVGPMNEATASVEFDEHTPTGAVGAVVKQMQEMGIGARYGRWLVTGRPQMVMLDHHSVFDHLHEIKYRFWERHHVEVPSDDRLINEVIGFGEVCRLFLSLLANRESSRRDIVAHFHEWMAGTAIPGLRDQHWPGAIVFTTHATILGRYLAGNNPVFYDHLPFFDPEKEASNFNIDAQHGIEAAAAHGSHVFTTVSDVTAKECTHLLKRTPDVVLPNGLNIQRFAAIHEFQNMHRSFKEQIHRFTMGHFFPSYHFDLDKTLYFFTSGRYEYLNKGMDLTIEALARLNHLLRSTGTDITVIAFIVTKANVRSVNVNALQTSAMLNELQTNVQSIKDQIGEKLFYAAARGAIPDLNTLVDDYYRLRLRRTIQAWRRDVPPGIVTHDLADDSNDPVLNQLRNCHLYNLAHDPVKVIFHPQFITPTNPLFGMEYDQFVRGCHLGVFPSYYEPWGYTPLESIALGVPAITSDLSGFGSYLAQLLPDHAEQGLFVVNRNQRSFHESADQLAHQMYQFCQMSRRERIALRNNVESFSVHFDWHNLGTFYREAHRLAIDRVAN